MHETSIKIICGKIKKKIEMVTLPLRTRLRKKKLKIASCERISSTRMIRIKQEKWKITNMENKLYFFGQELFNTNFSFPKLFHLSF